MSAWKIKLFVFGLVIANGRDITECHEGVEDCSFLDDLSSGTCAYNNQEYPAASTQGVTMVISTVFAMFMAFGIGANDAANSWATSVGSRAISIKKAVILCGIFEFLGATCLGSGVSSTIQKGVSDVDNPSCWACGYCNAQTSVYMSGMMGALIGASFFLLLASLTSIPVSTTHAIVGGVVGMTIAGAGEHCLNWEIDGGLGGIVLSWVISPVLSGLIAVVAYALSRRFIMKTRNPRVRALIVMPILYSVSAFILIFVTTLKAKAIKKKLDLDTKLIISLTCAILVGLFANFVVKPEVKRTFPSGFEAANHFQTTDFRITSGDLEMTKTGQTYNNDVNNTAGKVSDTALGSKADDKQIVSLHDQNDNEKMAAMDLILFNMNTANSADELDAIWVFRYLLVFNACLESFAHGSNDTANATGAFSAVYQMYTSGDDCQKSDSEIWIMAVAGVFVAVGVCTLGYRVIRTIGSKLTTIDYHKGFWIEFASTIATIIATLQGVPVSTTHCQVGAVFAVGLYSKLTNSGTVNMRLLTLIFLGWIITLPLSGGIAMLVVTLSRSILRSG